MTDQNKAIFLKRGLAHYDEDGKFSMDKTLKKIGAATLYLNESQVKVLASVMLHLLRDTRQADDVRLAANVDARSIVINHETVEYAAKRVGVDHHELNKDRILDVAAAEGDVEIDYIIENIIRRQK